jgi:hypothetical protein
MYHYDGDVKTALYLIDDGPRTFAINGFIHTRDPESIVNYWAGFENTLSSFTIYDPASSNLARNPIYKRAETGTV